MKALPTYEETDIERMIGSIISLAHMARVKRPITMSGFTWEWIERHMRESGVTMYENKNPGRALSGYAVELHQLTPTPGGAFAYIGAIDQIHVAGQWIAWKDFPKQQVPVTPKPMTDAINPEHYKKGGLEVIDILKQKLTMAEYEGFLKGNCIKYLLRADLKEGQPAERDYNKAAWYANMLAGKDPRTQRLTKEEWENLCVTDTELPFPKSTDR